MAGHGALRIDGSFWRRIFLAFSFQLWLTNVSVSFQPDRCQEAERFCQNNKTIELGLLGTA